MKRAFSWQTFAVVAVAVLIAAAFALINGNTGLAVALIVVAVGDGAFGAILVTFAQRKASRPS
jgi:hypothetical protein